MPIHRVASRDELETMIPLIEEAGEIVGQITADSESDGGTGFLIVTRLPVNETGRPWLPSNAKETRA